LLLGFTAVDRRGYNPLAAGVEQLFEDVVEGGSPGEICSLAKRSLLR
jgi:hypothetical protein